MVLLLDLATAWEISIHKYIHIYHLKLYMNSYFSFHKSLSIKETYKIYNLNKL
jgi:hypothetical protein